ncbi:hypothetical protein TWF506_005668 [Arthrobotrys conoides]|uniref:Carboxylesterase type B domain-containing protein n=1 Tax=Arthrobotrys conoides TaxID=74498 RepID=A0AAN8PQ14_9PEZI
MSFLDYDDATLIIRRNVVIVKIDYQLNSFRFIALNGTTAKDNYLGIEDMVQASKWVCVNTVASGGDPDYVTIAGDSVGAVAVRTLIGIEEAKGLSQASFKAYQAGGILHNNAWVRPVMIGATRDEVGCRE